MIYIAFFVFTFFVLWIAFYQWQYFMVFSPTYYRSDDFDANDFEILSIITDDGVELEGVIYEPWNATQTLLVFGGRNHDSVGLIKKLSQAYPKVTIVTFNYRSYGKSQGKASEKNLLNDSLKIAELLQKNYGDFSVLGFSLGANIATYLASKHPVQRLFLIGAFDSLAAVVKNKIGFHLRLRYTFDTLAYMKNVAAPTYLFASRSDEVIHIENTRTIKPFVRFLVHYEEFEAISHEKLLFEAKIVQRINKALHEGI